MPEHSISESIMTHLNAQEPWPDNVKLYQPYEVEQILLPDNASCLAVQAFLKMCNLPFEVEMRWNAEYMSPSGRVPFIKCGAFVVSELEPIVQFAANKGVSLCSRLSTEEKAEMRAYMSLITNVLLNAELYISWVDNDTFTAVTKVRNSSVFPWPLGWIQTRAKRNQVAKRLKALHWYDKTLDQVLADVEQCCNSLSQRLGDKEYFFGTPTPLDALIYGHVRALLSATGPKAGEIIKPITSALLRHMLRITHLTGMKMTSPEEELVGVAWRVLRRQQSPERASEKSSKTRRSKGSLTVRNASTNSLRKRELFGFKPFASKQILVSTTPDGSVTCEYIGDRLQAFVPISEEHTNFILEIIEDILDKVEEFVFDEFTVKIQRDNEKHDFEVIAFTNQDMDSKYGSVDMKLDDLYEEADMTESVDGGLEDILNIINDDDEDNLDSDGLINDKLLAAAEVPELLMEAEGLVLQKPSLSPNFTDSSNFVHRDDFITTVTSSGDQSVRKSLSPDPDDRSVKSVHSAKSVPSSVISNKTVMSALSYKSRQSADTDATLKFPIDSEISIESLMRYLRKRNAAYRNVPEIADLD